MNLTTLGPMLLTALSWGHAWLIGCRGRRRRIAGWLLGAGILAPASALYAYLTGQLPYILANAVFAVLAVRGLRSAVSGRTHLAEPGRLVARSGQTHPTGQRRSAVRRAPTWRRAPAGPAARLKSPRRTGRHVLIAARR